MKLSTSGALLNALGILAIAIGSPSQAGAASSSDPAALNGHWKYRKPEMSYDNPPYWVNRTLDVKYPNITLTQQYFDSPFGKPTITQTIEGQFAVAKNDLNDQVMNLDLIVSKNIVTLGSAETIKRIGMTACAKPGVPLDVFKSGCGVYAHEKEASKLYYIYTLKLGNQLLLGGVRNTPTAENKRPVALNIDPMVKSP